ncbi:phenoloxidase-activating factor 3-like [Sitophilus oryzae]|uniref:CLIP domain-containing serine protease n=1 Tax=Sitophilus oryzae TaxID=7048 RepID=A0A6J2YWJ0_SITOR|nr:phenoloxidase-activating factor 3-like [Sitophilus oryzae]
MMYLILLFGIFCSVNAQNVGGFCRTPSGESAKCINIYQCNSILVLLRLPSRTSDQVQFLRDSQCGSGANGAPLVCCGSSSALVKTTLPEENIPYKANSLIPDRTSCGIQTNSRIFGGEQTDLDEYPWMAIFQYQNIRGEKKYGCAGSLINSRYVLTAGHCVTGPVLTKLGQLVNVRLGEWDTDSPNRDCREINGKQICNDPEINVGVDEIIPYPRYNPDDNDKSHDIALIRLQRPVQFTKYIFPICLPLPNEGSVINDSLIVAGWGKTEYGRNSNLKLKLEVPFTDKTSCASLFRTYNINIGNGQICAGGADGKDSCTGDSGGPLMRTFPNDQFRWYIEGIVSFGMRCGTEGWPAVYTRVAEYVAWVHRTVRQ